MEEVTLASLHLHVDAAFSISWFLTTCGLLLSDEELQFCVSPLFILLSNCIKHSHILDSYGLSDFNLMSTYNIKVSNICIYADLTWPHSSKNSFQWPPGPSRLCFWLQCYVKESLTRIFHCRAADYIFQSNISYTPSGIPLRLVSQVAMKYS